MDKMSHETYRLIESDEDAMSLALRREWDSLLSPRNDEGTRAMLRRVAARAIGCTLSDLRGSEIQWIDNEIGELERGLA